MASRSPRTARRPCPRSSSASQLERGAWGITAAVPHQARVYRAYGIGRIFLANEVVDAVALRWLA